jgi:hypothetical protein
MRSKTLNNFDLDSFERFCDDLCELLLSFLPISDKIKFECVSKQWNRLIFNRKQKLIITYSEDNKYTIKRICYERKPSDISPFIKYCINTTLLEKVLQKFQFITHLEINTGKDNACKFYFEPKVLELIATYCKFLKIFECDYCGFNIKEEHFNDFGLKCGQHLEYFRYDYIISYHLKAFMPSINKIKALHMKYNSLNAKDLMEERFSKIEEISFGLSDVQNMILFTDNFHSKIKKIYIQFNKIFSSENVINNYLLQISRLEELNNLRLDLCNYTTFNSSIDDTLKIIGKKLLKLKYLFIKSTFQRNFDISEDCIKGNLFPILSEFKTIEYLKICYKKFSNNVSNVDRFGPIQSLKSCKHLKYLSIIANRDFSDEEIEEYKFHFSGLSYLEIDCCNRKLLL